MTTYTPRHEDITGANLTGSDGTANRTYALANSNSIGAQFQIIVSGAILQASVDFTLANDTITFLNVVWNDQNITLDYFTESTTSASSGTYTSTLEIARIAGIGVEVQGENLGTGDGSERSYDLDNGNVLASSYTLQYGDSGSNSLSTLEETTHYTIDKDKGAIYLTATGRDLVNGKVIYASYTYSPKQSDTVLNSFLAQIDEQVDKLTGNHWGTAETTTEYFDGYDSGYPQTEQPYGTDIDPQPEFELKNKGLQSTPTVVFLANDGSVSSTLNSTYIRWSDDGRVILTQASVPNGKRNVKITYSHGYSSVPVEVSLLAAYIGGMMALVNISGGSYKDVSTYSIGRKSFSIGQVYVNIESSIKQMKARIDEITSDLGYRWAIA